MRSIARRLAALHTYRCGRHVCGLTLLRRRAIRQLDSRRSGRWPRDRRRRARLVEPRLKTRRDNARAPPFHRRALSIKASALTSLITGMNGTLSRGRRHGRKSRERTLARANTRTARGGDWSNAARRGHAHSPRRSLARMTFVHREHRRVQPRFNLIETPSEFF